MIGKAFLIGGGPGDEELITVKGKRVLEKCTAVMYDRLVSPNVLNYLKKDCEIFYCGKKPGEHSMKQEEINELLVSLVKKGHIVGRIKGGDPYVFGRGGEEALALLKEGLEFEVIPGITSPISVLNYGGIPITHRGLSQSFHIVTGMSSKSLDINWQALSKENGTLVFMMGLENLQNIVDNLIKNGKNKDTASAIIMRGASSKQKKVVGQLSNIQNLAIENKLESPCIIVVGDVVKLNDKLNWLEKKPLFGKNICITRTKEQATFLKNSLKDLGAYVTEINSIEIESTYKALDSVKERLFDYNHVVCTSINGVNNLFAYIVENEIDIRLIKANFYAIGDGTKRALIEKGIVPKITANVFTQEGLFEAIKENIKKDDLVLIPTSDISRDYLKNNLEKISAKVDKISVYKTVCPKIKDMRAIEDVDLILFTSPSTVKNMVKLVGVEKINEKIVVSIGPKTLEEAKKYNIDSKVLKSPSEKEFIENIEKFF